MSASLRSPFNSSAREFWTWIPFHVLDAFPSHFVDEYDPTIEGSYACGQFSSCADHTCRLVPKTVSRGWRSGHTRCSGHGRARRVFCDERAVRFFALFFDLILIRYRYMRTGEGFLLVYSITSRQSFSEISAFHQQILRVKDQDAVPVLMVGNKCDLEYERQVGMSEGRDLARHLGAPFMETSAKQRINVEEAFYGLVREIRRFNNVSGNGSSDTFCETNLLFPRLSNVPRNQRTVRLPQAPGPWAGIQKRRRLAVAADVSFSDDAALHSSPQPRFARLRPS